MASIVKRSKSFCVVYNTYEKGRKRQVWETYHSEDMALRHKAQIEMIRAVQNESAERKNMRGKETLADLMVEYVDVYGRIHWSCSTYTSNCALIKTISFLTLATYASVNSPQGRYKLYILTCSRNSSLQSRHTLYSSLRHNCFPVFTRYCATLLNKRYCGNT